MRVREYTENQFLQSLSLTQSIQAGQSVLGAFPDDEDGEASCIAIAVATLVGWTMYFIM